MVTARYSSQELFANENPSRGTHLLSTQEEDSLHSEESLTERTTEGSFKTTYSPPRSEEGDEIYNHDDSSNHDDERCSTCGERINICRPYQCQLDHCSSSAAAQHAGFA